MPPRSIRLAWHALAFLPVACAALLLALGSNPALAAPEKVAGGIRFTYTDANAGTVSWAGDFNGWNATDHVKCLIANCGTIGEIQSFK